MIGLLPNFLRTLCWKMPKIDTLPLKFCYHLISPTVRVSVLIICCVFLTIKIDNRDINNSSPLSNGTRMYIYELTAELSDDDYASS